MTNESILREFIDRVWNKKDFGSVSQFVAPEYTIHIDTGDQWEGKTLNIDEYKVRMRYSFDSFPDIHFEIRLPVEKFDLLFDSSQIKQVLHNLITNAVEACKGLEKNVIIAVEIKDSYFLI